jgi:hypothetical protein
MTKQQFYFRIAQFIVTAVFIIIGSKVGINAVAVAFILAYLTIVLFKMVVISNHIGVSFGESIRNAMSAYKLLIVMIPLYMVLQYFIPNVLWGNIVKCVVFAFAMLCCFILFPSVVGDYYKNNAYDNIICFFKTRVLHKSSH